MKVTINQAKELAVIALQSKLVPMIHGSPAIGKSAIVRQIAKMFNLLLIDVRLGNHEPSEMSGFPSVRGEKIAYIPTELFPVEGDKIPDGYAGWLVFMDELTSATPVMQAAAYKVILDRLVGNKRLHSNVAIIGAGNLETDNAVVFPMSEALKSRMVHLEA